jgi:hypothetical protein
MLPPVLLTEFNDMMATKWMGGPLPRKLPEAANYGAVHRRDGGAASGAAG